MVEGQQRLAHLLTTAHPRRYDPMAITTRDGALEITLTQKNTHGLNYQGEFFLAILQCTDTRTPSGGMLQSWNKMCFTGGIVEVGVTLPGSPEVQGLWPALWVTELCFA